MTIRNEVFITIINTLNNYEYCILRNYEKLPEFDNDIDILIKDGTTKLLIDELIKNLLPLSVIYLYKVRFSCLSVFFYDKISEIFIHLDFFEEIKWKIFIYLPAEEILKSRVKYKDFYIPSPFFEMYELLLTRLIYQGKIKEKYKDKIKTLFSAYSKKSNYKFYINFDKQISNEEWGKIEELVIFIRLKIILYNISNPQKLIKNLFSFITRSLSRLIKPPGLFIAFYGVDGCGKSTQIKMIIENFSGLYSNKIKIFHFRPNFIYKIPSEVAVTNPHSQSRANTIRSFLKLIFYVFIYNWGYFTQILPLLVRNGLVIFDRYFLDLFVDPIRYRLNISNKLIKFLSKFIPKPHINFFLYANPNTIFTRKPEVNVEEIKKQQKKLMQKVNNRNFFRVCTDIDKYSSYKIIKNIIIAYVKGKQN